MGDDLADEIFRAVKEVEDQQTSVPVRTTAGGGDAELRSAAASGRDTNLEAEVDRLLANFSVRDDPRFAKGGLGGWQTPSQPWPSPQLAEFQQALVLGGYLSFNDYKEVQAYGMAGDETKTAIGRLLKQAKANNMDPMEMLAMRAKSGGFEALGGGRGRQRAPLSIQLTNPEDIKKVAQNVAQSVVGRALSSEEEQSVISQYQGLEKTSQTKQYQVAATGGTAVAPPDLSVTSEKVIREKAPVESGAHDVLTQFETLKQILGVR